MNLSNNRTSLASEESTSDDNLRKRSPLDSLCHMELKKTIEAEDKKLTDTLLDQILSDPVLETCKTIDEGKSVQSKVILDDESRDPLTNVNNRISDESPVREKTENLDLHLSKTAMNSVTVNTANAENILCEQDASNTKKSSESPAKEYRCPEEDWSADDSLSSSSSDSSDSELFFEAMREGPAPKKIMPIKSKGELDLDDLPPIEDLVISVSELEMEQIGKIYAIVDKLVVVRAFKNLKALDIDSVLFLSHDNVLGRVFDVFGPVVEPFYSIRFNNDEHIREKGITVDAPVYYAPKKDEITSYVFIDQLQNQRGSDASWKDNNEPPEQFLDYSDDEQERSARRRRAERNRNQNINSSNDLNSKRPHLEGHSQNTPTYIPPPRPVSRQSALYPRPNPFLSPHPLLSTPQPYLSSPSPFNIPRTHMPFPSPMPYPPPRPLHMQGGHHALVFPAYQQPVFGQVSVLGPVSPALHAPRALRSPVLTTVPTLIPAHPLPHNYFAQRFPQSPSPGPVSPDPWLPNQAPYQQTYSLPPNAPLTVQIPPSSPSLPVQHMNGSVPPFIQNAFNQPQRNFPNGMKHPPFY